MIWSYIWLIFSNHGWFIGVIPPKEAYENHLLKVFFKHQSIWGFLKTGGSPFWIVYTGDPTMWGPPVISWFRFTPVTIVTNTINHSYWSYVHQLSYRTGASHCMNMDDFRFTNRKETSRCNRATGQFTLVLSWLILAPKKRFEDVFLPFFMFTYFWELSNSSTFFVIWLIFLMILGAISNHLTKINGHINGWLIFINFLVLIFDDFDQNNHPKDDDDLVDSKIDILTRSTRVYPARRFDFSCLVLGSRCPSLVPFNISGGFLKWGYPHIIYFNRIFQ